MGWNPISARRWVSLVSYYKLLFLSGFVQHLQFLELWMLEIFCWRSEIPWILTFSVQAMEFLEFGDLPFKVWHSLGNHLEFFCPLNMIFIKWLVCILFLFYLFKDQFVKWKSWLKAHLYGCIWIQEIPLIFFVALKIRFHFLFFWFYSQCFEN